jgi:hypothetical protein
MGLGKLKILIVDDDEGDRKQIRRALKRSELAHDCIETVSIEEALAACGKCVFDCAIIGLLDARTKRSERHRRLTRTVSFHAHRDGDRPGRRSRRDRGHEAWGLGLHHQSAPQLRVDQAHRRDRR